MVVSLLQGREPVVQDELPQVPGLDIEAGLLNGRRETIGEIPTIQTMFAPKPRAGAEGQRVGLWAQEVAGLEVSKGSKVSGLEGLPGGAVSSTRTAKCRVRPPELPAVVDDPLQGDLDDVVPEPHQPVPHPDGVLGKDCRLVRSVVAHPPGS